MPDSVEVVESGTVVEASSVAFSVKNNGAGTSLEFDSITDAATMQVWDHEQDAWRTVRWHFSPGEPVRLVYAD